MLEIRRWVTSAGVRLALLSGLFLLPWAAPARAGLDDYVKKPDPAFAWKHLGNRDTPLGKIHNFELTSQVWQGTTWKHALEVFEPKKIDHPDAVLLFITGGHNEPGKPPKGGDSLLGFTLATVCGARVAVLHQVPNQPLLGDKKEDDLIAETFVRYLETRDETWPLLFPMAKSAVRAMDAVQAWARESGGPEVKRFVVSGASKRGWTTWLTGASDDRVIGIAPMVIVMLNLGTQGPNQLDVWGKYSEQIDDYVRRGLMERAQTKEGAPLWKMVDPYTYRDRLTMPKLLINGTNDRYWTLNAIDLYWPGLKGPKSLIELPNAGHGLDQNREWATNGLGAFFRHTVNGRAMPKISWSFAGGGSKAGATMTIHADPAPKSARLWTAHAPQRDFREAHWEPAPLTVGETIAATVPPASDGHTAALGELEYEVDGLSYHLTTTFFVPGAPRVKP